MNQPATILAPPAPRKRLNLMLHCGSRSVSRADVDSSSTPSPEGKWHPIPHRDLIELVLKNLADQGLSVVQETHGLFGAKGANPSDRYFGMFEIATNSGEFSTVLGLRNSHDKKFSAGLCLGNGTFICDNLIFSAEVTFGRRHTVHIMRDLPNMVQKSVAALMKARITQAQRVEAYKDCSLTRGKALELFTDSCRKGAFPKSKLFDVVSEYEGLRVNPGKVEHRHIEFSDRNVYSAQQAVTQLWKESHRNTANVLDNPNRTAALLAVLDPHAKLFSQADAKAELKSEFGDVIEVR